MTSRDRRKVETELENASADITGCLHWRAVDEHQSPKARSAMVEPPRT